MSIEEMPRIERTTPVFHVADVAATIRWYLNGYVLVFAQPF